MISKEDARKIANGVTSKFKICDDMCSPFKEDWQVLSNSCEIKKLIEDIQEWTRDECTTKSTPDGDSCCENHW